MFKISLVLLLMLALGCGADQEAGVQCVEAVAPQHANRCQGHTNLGVCLEHESWLTSEINNVIHIHGDVAWVVHSGNHTVGRLDLKTGAFERDFVDVGASGLTANPWSVVQVGERLYITNQASSSLTIADVASGHVIADISDTLVAPQGLATDGQLLVVANTHFVAGAYEPASVTVFRLLDAAPWVTWVGNIETSALNTSDVVYDTKHQQFYAINTGAFGVDEHNPGVYGIISDGSVDVLSAAMLQAEALEHAVLGTVALPRHDGFHSAAPGDLVLDSQGNHAYVASSVTPELYQFDRRSLNTIRGTDNPLVLYPKTEDNQLTRIAIRPDGLLYVLAYNEDALFVFDTACGEAVAGPFDLGTNPNFLEGPGDVVYHPEHNQALVLMTLSNAITRVEGP